ncbi:MAG: double zinc ribbon domain-containing protein [Gaiellaceae bacterium]
MPERVNDPFARQARPPEPGAEVVEVVEVVETSEPPEPDPVTLERERRELTSRREIEMRDVGGLAVEMVRRDRLNPDLLVSRAREVLALEQRMHELDSLLVAEATARSYPNVAYCKCGAPLVPGVHFCGHCGRPAATTPAVLTCAHCGQALPADVNFCSFCGNPAAAGKDEPAGEPLDETVVRPPPPDDETQGTM